MSDELTARARMAMPFAALLDLEVLSGDATTVVGTARWQPEYCTLGGALHGGYLMGLADSIGATLTALLLPPDASGTTTIETKTNFFRAVRDGMVTISATPIHAGRTTIVVQVDITDDRERLVARTSQTQLILR